ACVRTDVQSRWLDAMRNARLGYSRAFALMDAVGMAALFSGLVQGCHNWLNSDPMPTRPTEAWAVVFALCSVSLPVLARISARSAQNRFAAQETSFFFWDQGHVANRDARNYLLAAAVFVGLLIAGVVGLLLNAVNAAPPTQAALPGSLAAFLPGLFTSIGI